MITSLRLVNFKNFADETLRVGPFTVIVGANASGKSNIRDAFRFLHGIGRAVQPSRRLLVASTVPEVNLEWDQAIRGAPNEIARVGQSPRPRMSRLPSPLHVDIGSRRAKDFAISITVRL